MKKNYPLRNFLILIIFIFIFFIIPFDIKAKYVAVLALAPLGLFLSKKCSSCFIAFIVVAYFLAIVSFGISFYTISIIIIFATLIPSSYIFSEKNYQKDDLLDYRNKELKILKENLKYQEKKVEIEGNILKKELENIIQIYTVSKNLTGKMTGIDGAEEIVKFFSSLKEVKNVVVALRNKQNKFVIAGIANSQMQHKWSEAINNSSIENLSKVQITDFFYDVENDLVITCPIILDNVLTSCILLVADKKDCDMLLERIKIFLPHFVLESKRIKLFTQLNERARLDGLTGLYIRRYFVERLANEIKRSKRYKTDFFIMMADLDFFKKINDTYGHLAGDKVLIEVSKIFKNSLRSVDLAARYGGEEFIFLLPDVSQEEVLNIAEKIRTEIKAIKFVEADKNFSVTISIGIVKYENKLKTKNIIELADKALYKAKQRGRDRIFLSKYQQEFDF